MTLLTILDSSAEAPDHNTILDGAVALGIRAASPVGPSSEAIEEAIEHLLRASIALAVDHAVEHDLNAETVLRTVPDREGAVLEYRRAYAAESGVRVAELHRDVGWWPDELPLFEGMPAAFIERVARAEAAQDRARCAAMREMASAR